MSADTPPPSDSAEGDDHDGDPPAVPTRYGVPLQAATDDGSGPDMDVLHPSADELTRVVEALRDDGHNLLLDVTAVDYLTYEGDRRLPATVAPGRYEVVVTLISHRRRTRIRLKVQVDESAPVVPSLFDLFPGSENLEREVFDMFGIRFEGHPDLTRILMPEDWEGHPLRKDYAVGRIPVQFKGAPEEV